MEKQRLREREGPHLTSIWLQPDQEKETRHLAFNPDEYDVQGSPEKVGPRLREFCRQGKTGVTLMATPVHD